MNKFMSSVPPEFLATLNMNGLRGRMLRLPAEGPTRREILFVYGHRSTIESVYGYVQTLRSFGAVTVPDLPGIGGMESFFKLKERPTLDTMAGYLASFVKLRYRRRRLTIIGQGYGFLVVTRMLTNYPEIADRVDALLSIDGFAHHNDLRVSRLRRFPILVATTVLGRPYIAKLARPVLLNPALLRHVYTTRYGAPATVGRLSGAQRRSAVALEVLLWRTNDFRTYLSCIKTMLVVNNCRGRIDLPVWQLLSRNQTTIDELTAEQRLRVIYSHYHKVTISGDRLEFSGIVKPRSPTALTPRKIRRLLQKKS